ncbi:MAG: carboxypeptidase-like regulatory domain-containing protein [Algibacter sp.]
MQKLKIIILFLLPYSVIAQNIEGKIYDEESTVKGAKIINLNKNTITHTDDKGDFKIKASINDTLFFSSFFHKEKKLKLIKNHFNNTIIIELKKAVNSLDEVILIKENKTFNKGAYTADLGTQIKNDIKNNPHLYQAAPSGNLDVLKVIGLVSKLFKNKKTKEPPLILATYKQFDSLFSNDKLFNDELLINDLKIPKQYKPLFFDYCETKNINKDLLQEKNRMILLDTLFNSSKSFLKIISNYEKTE